MDLFEELKELQTRIDNEISILNAETKFILNEKQNNFEQDLDEILMYFTTKYLPLIKREMKVTLYGVTLVFKPRHLQSGSHIHYCSENELIRVDLSPTDDSHSTIIFGKFNNKYQKKYALWLYSDYNLKPLVDNFNKEEVDNLIASEITKRMIEELKMAQIENKNAKEEV